MFLYLEIRKCRLQLVFVLVEKALAFWGLVRVSFSKISRYSVVIGTISHGFMSCLVAYVPWKSCRPAIVMCDAACLSEGVF